MCGIVGYVGKDKKIREIFDLAYKNKHRGDDDGFGYYDFTNSKMTRTLLDMDEVEDGEISLAKDDKKGLFKRRLAILKKELKQTTNFILFHHRKASSGSACTSNTHPIKIRKDIYYCQNGTVGGYSLLKRYFEIYNREKYHTDTDTEVIAKFIENEYRKDGVVKAFNRAEKLFRWIGVMIRMDIKNNNLIIFKDDDRSLFVYEIKGDYLMISEPLPSIREFDKCYRLDWGVFQLNKEGLGVIVGEMNEVGNRIKVFIPKADGTFKCDCCGGDNNSTIKAYDTQDFCLGCSSKTTI